ncbi:MAG: hypothetical protein TR69_WS6001001414 [candidate division WS6 bacterium OLB20]|uniref:Uncharacterized protein n=1 Tax=candidate division WS6 bacterium OLB20 TaxID=1617426 RepID=A0A136LVX9_9BACT|nr:MAG: hypothetical protein TR69_WS6001001414 [candidate division WS6 bacterium OLB20]
MHDTIAMPPRKTYPGVVFPLTVILLGLLIGMSYTIISMQQQLAEQQRTLLSVNNQLQQLNQIVMGDEASAAIESSGNNPEVLAEEMRVISYDATGVSFNLQPGLMEIGDPVTTATAPAAAHQTFVYKDDLREYYTLTVINGSGQQEKLNVTGWKLSAKITVAQQDSSMYRGNESMPASELYVLPAGKYEVGFLFMKNEDVTAEPELTFDQAIAKTLASVTIE